MGIFKKKKVNEPEIPQLPELPKLPELPGVSSELFLPELPKIEEQPLGQPSSLTPPDITPNSKYASPKKLEQPVSLIKTPPQVKNEPEEDIIEPTTESLIPPPTKKPLPSIRIEESENENLGNIEAIYVRLDKFQNAVNSFDEIKTKILEVEEILRKIKGIKDKEDEELKEWEKELESMKIKIEGIDKNIFSKIQ